MSKANEISSYNRKIVNRQDVFINIQIRKPLINLTDVGNVYNQIQMLTLVIFIIHVYINQFCS